MPSVESSFGFPEMRSRCTGEVLPVECIGRMPMPRFATPRPQDRRDGLRPGSRRGYAAAPSAASFPRCRIGISPRGRERRVRCPFNPGPGRTGRAGTSRPASRQTREAGRLAADTDRDDQTEAVVVVSIRGMIVVAIRGTQIDLRIIVPRTATQNPGDAAAVPDSIRRRLAAPVRG